jgi:hypothetical protein
MPLATTRLDIVNSVNTNYSIFADQIIPPVQSNAPNQAELKARLEAMSSVKGANISNSDTEQEALNKLASVGVSGKNVPLSANQRLAVDYQIAAMLGTEHDLLQTYTQRNDPNLTKLLNAYVVESKLREKASVIQHPKNSTTQISEHPEVFRIITSRVQHNISLIIEAGGRLAIYNREPTQEERCTIQSHLAQSAGNHPDSKVLSHNADHSPAL